ncbi:prosaposin-like [Etheostoma cragini]|uniref:prosaposin-like n=1 Tax=Etheostoma cragini TaxID=417921 RepID=UPI00155F1154|nr:prosaposin-like [Etheostoma cragini]XP_034752568.1 prosaposin-like [Etheostoma cragini]XP_034752569.1 prosaposin-like [Etheostoma cragini]
MASLKIALLLFVCLEGCALTLALNFNGLQNVPDALRATGDVCQDCTQIFELLADLFSNSDLQKKIIDGIENLCDHLPGPASTAKLCKEEVEKMLPVAINLIAGAVKPAEICKLIGLCDSSEKLEKMLRFFVKETLQVAVTREKVQPKTQCTFCIFLIKTLEELLPKESTEDALIKLLEEICHLLPSTYHDQCEAVIGKFTKTVLEAILSYATPQNICTLIQLCKGQEAPLVDPCTLTTYRCRDVKTALRCGTVFYCQRYAWKPLDTL